MFSKTRQKIVLVTAAVLMLFLALTLGLIYMSNWLSVNAENAQMLERYVRIYSLESPPGESVPGPPPGESAPELSPGESVPADLPPADDPGAVYQLSSFYSAAFSPEGEVLAVDTGRNGLYTKEEIVETARLILGENKASGYSPHLLYRVEHREEYTLVAFMDMTITDNSMWNLLIYTLMGGAVAICILTVVSVWLSKRIVEPLEENDRKQKQFISNAGHELKTPVAVISANAEILERQIGQNDWLDNIKYENRRMGELVTGLLDLSHAESASIPMEPVDLSRLVEREVLPFESVAFEQGLMVESEIGEGIRVNGNPAQLRQLVSILMDNAIRHGKGGDTVKISLKADRRTAVLIVENSGEISRDKLDRIFERFYRADEARTDSEKGSHYGLGLAIAKAVTESHGGKIRAESEEGKVRFIVELPV